MKIILTLLILLCSQAYAETSNKKIFSILPASTHVFWKTVEMGVMDAAKENSYQALVRTGHEEFQYKKGENVEIELINYMKNKGARYIILAPSPAINKNIKIPDAQYIFAGRGADNYTLPYRGLTLVAINDVLAGKKAAQSLKDVLPKGSKVGAFDVELNILGTNNRVKGFVEEAHELGFKVVFNIPLGHGIREAQQNATKAFKIHPDVKAVFTPNELSTVSTIRAIRELPAGKKPLHVGFDYRSMFSKSLVKGELHAVILQDAYRIGRECALAVIQAEKGQKVKSRIEVDTFVINKSNLEDPDTIKRLRFYK